MNGVSKTLVTLGFALLLTALLFSLFFVYRETEALLRFDERDVQWNDSLFSLLREKDDNMLRLLRAMNEPAGDLISTSEIEEIIAEQDTVHTQQRVQRRVTAHRDTVVTRPHRKGFFRRLGEVFVPPKKDTAIEVKTSFEYAMDTVIEPYHPADSLQERLREVARQKREVSRKMQYRRRNLQRKDHQLTERIDSLLEAYEAATVSRARQEAEHRQEVRHRSARVVGGIAVGAVLLSALFLVIIMRDITRSNRYRRQLEEARRRAEELLAARERMMLAITHDFKAPLGSIMGYADLLAPLVTEERQRLYLDAMKHSSDHLLKLVTDLLDFHRLDLNKAEVHRVTFSPADLLEEIHVSFMPLAAKKGLALNVSVAEELRGRYVCDPVRLRQILTNLLSNAVKFTQQGSITLTAAYAGRRLVLSVADTGKGMDPSDRERIFREFTRLPGAQGEEGFGLGLSIVRMLVQLLEGTIEVESALGKGSTFTVRIPLFPVSGASVPDGKPSLPEAPVPAGEPPKCVLLIDDDRIQLALTAAMLKQAGMEAVCCLLPDELFDALRSGRFDVLLTDVQMPALNGFELLKLLRASNVGQARTLPVIAVTARGDMQREAFLEQGFAGCLRKPFTVAELLDELSHSAQSPRYDFAALTACAADDPEAAQAILESFFSETRLNADKLRRALEARDAATLSAVGHKMLPLFRLIGAHRIVSRLEQLEATRDHCFTDGLGRLVRELLAELDAMLP